MDIRFISSLTPEDESQLAQGMISAIQALLDQLPIAYVVRIETSGAKIYQHTHVVAQESASTDAEPAVLPSGFAANPSSGH